MKLLHYTSIALYINQAPVLNYTLQITNFLLEISCFYLPTSSIKINKTIVYAAGELRLPIKVAKGDQLIIGMIEVILYSNTFPVQIVLMFSG